MKSYREKEDACRLLFEDARARYGRFYHLFTPGDSQELLFTCEADFRFGMNVIASAALDTPGVRIVTFELMSNHIHVVLAGTQEAIRSFFSLVKKRLRRHYSLSGKTVSFDRFEAGLKETDDLDSLRNVIAYCNRNNYVVDPEETPFSYPYGANGFFFNPSSRAHLNPRYGDLTIHQKRAMMHSHAVDYPTDLPVIDGYLSPAGYCDISLGEKMFRDARHYFYKISRDLDSYASVAAGIGDTISYTDDELYAAACRICAREHGAARPSLVDYPSKVKLAQTLHYQYNASNKQLSRILRMEIRTLGEMFPSGY